MKRLALLVLGVLWLTPAHAQSVTKLCFPTVVTGSGKTSCQNVTSTNPLPTTATLSAAGGVNVTVTNTVGVPVQVSNPNGLGGSVSGTLTVQNLGAGSLVNVLDTNSAALLSAVQAAIPAGSNLIGKVGIDQTTPGTTNAVSVQYGSTAAFADPCKTQTPTIKPFSITTATTTNIVTGTSAKKLYVCYLYMQTVAANNIAVISGTTGATCGANTAALVGGTTAANGLNNAANGGQAFGKGDSAVMQVATNNDDICIITSAATPLAGLIKYVVQ